MKDFRSFLFEAKDQLDISIVSADKWLTNDKKKLEFLSTPVKVEHKADGIKITLIYKDNTGDYTKDWIVSYKGEIQYPGEFDFMSDYKIKKSAIANSQFKLIFNHLEKITPSLSGIPKNTEFFVEYLMKKPTLSSSYTKSHGMVLIAHSKTKWSDNMGKLKSSPVEFNTDREHYAKLLKLDIPLVLFDGILGSEVAFRSGIKHSALKSIFDSNKSINWSDKDSIIMNIKEMFLEVESKYGGKEEGVVITYKDGSKIIKFQQSYQVDQTARAAIKMQYKEDDAELEQQYWNNVRVVALSVIRQVTKGLPIKYVDLPEKLKEAASILAKEKLTFTHSKKNKEQILDDIQGNIKMIMRKQLKGNNNFLFLGKMRILSNAHYNIIKKGLQDYDNGVVCLVTSKDTANTKDLREKMLKAAFPNIEIVHHSTGNIFGIMNKADTNINVILAGSDRVQSYRELLKNNPDMYVEETYRTDDDISASKIIENITDKEYFKANTPKEIHQFYNELVEVYR